MKILRCWKCGREGNFSGQVCDECFDKMQERHQAIMEEYGEEFHRCEDYK